MQAAAPSPLVLLLLAVAPPQLGGPLFLPFPLLLYFYPSLRQRAPGAWVKRSSSEPLREGLLMGVRPLPPNPNPSHPCSSLRSSIPLPGRSSQPHLRAASGCKNAQLGGGGVGGGGRGLGGGALGRGLMELWGLPSFPPPQCKGLELAPQFPGQRCRGAG